MINFKNILQSFPFINSITELSEELEYPAYIVGGFVRDQILIKKNLLPATKKEIDFLIVGNGTEFAKKLSKKLGIKDVTIFRNFGTAHFKYYDFDFEFVGARKESYKKNSRNPIVETGSFEDDIARRDFTINTLAVSLNKNTFGELIDTYDGLNDIKNKLIKTPIDPLITFNDDPLRIMRAFRFASQLNFIVDETILNSAIQLKERIKIVSQERITDEFLKILATPIPSIGLNLLFKAEILEIIFPELARMRGVDQKKDFHHKDVFYHTLQVVDNIAQHTNNIWLRFSALVHDIAKPNTKKFIEGIGWSFHGHEEMGARMMKSIFTRLKLSFNQIDYVKKLIRLHLRPIALAKDEVTDSAIRRFIVECGENLEDLITLCRADITSKNLDKVSEYLNNYERVMKKVIEVKEKDKLREFQSPVRGEEIMRICNLKPSKKVGEIKTKIEEAILDGVIENNYEEAFKYFMKIKDEILSR